MDKAVSCRKRKSSASRRGALATLWASREAALRGLRDDVEREERQLAEERRAAEEADASLLASLESAALDHPLHALLSCKEGSSQDEPNTVKQQQQQGVHDDVAQEGGGGLLRRALIALGRGALLDDVGRALREREQAAEQREAAVRATAERVRGTMRAVREREDTLDARERAMQHAQAALAVRQTLQQLRESALSDSERVAQVREASLWEKRRELERGEASVRGLEEVLRERQVELLQTQDAVRQLERSLLRKEVEALDAQREHRQRSLKLAAREYKVQCNEARLRDGVVQLDASSLALRTHRTRLREAEAVLLQREAALLERERRLAAISEGEQHGQGKTPRGATSATATSGAHAATSATANSAAATSAAATSAAATSAAAASAAATSAAATSAAATSAAATSAAATSAAASSAAASSIAATSAVASSATATSSVATSAVATSTSASTAVAAPSPHPLHPAVVATTTTSIPTLCSPPAKKRRRLYSRLYDEDRGAVDATDEAGQQQQQQQQQGDAIGVSEAVPAVSAGSSPGGATEDVTLLAPIDHDSLPHDQDDDVDSVAQTTDRDDDDQVEQQQQLGCSVDKLPDDLLALVLAAVGSAVAGEDADGDGGPAAFAAVHALLSLRLVCRRWRRVALLPSVWAARRLRVTDGLTATPASMACKMVAGVRVSLGGGATVLAALRIAPALAALDVDVPRNGTAVCFRAFAEGKVQVHSLRLRYRVSKAANLLVRRALDARGATLRALELQFEFASHLSTVTPALQAAERLAGLRKLTLGGPCWSHRHFAAGRVDFEFQGFPALEHLVLGAGLTQATAASAVRACRATLRVVDCGRYDVLTELAECSELRRVAVHPGPVVATPTGDEDDEDDDEVTDDVNPPATDDGGGGGRLGLLLRRLRHLEALDVYCCKAEHLVALKEFLEQLGTPEVQQQQEEGVGDAGGDGAATTARMRCPPRLGLRLRRQSTDLLQSCLTTAAALGSTRVSHLWLRAPHGPSSRPARALLDGALPGLRFLRADLDQDVVPDDSAADVSASRAATAWVSEVRAQRPAIDAALLDLEAAQPGMAFCSCL